MELTRPKIESHNTIFLTGTRAHSRVSGNDRVLPCAPKFNLQDIQQCTLITLAGPCQLFAGPTSNFLVEMIPNQQKFAWHLDLYWKGFVSLSSMFACQGQGAAHIACILRTTLQFIMIPVNPDNLDHHHHGAMWSSYNPVNFLWTVSKTPCDIIASPQRQMWDACFLWSVLFLPASLLYVV